MSFVNLKNLNVIYRNKNHILKDLNLSLEKGELVSLLGPSGCGKTTTLRIVAGLLEANSGQFLLEGQDMTHVPVHQRQFGMVFQSYALFPHLTIFDNVAFGLKLKKETKEVIDEKVNHMLHICGLDNLGTRYPKELSGGQRQRVALARALVIEPKLLLLDEPLSNLDAKLRIQMRLEIKRIQQQLNITTLFVTHDQEECFSISDKVAVMNNGIIEQFDTPEMIYNYPKTEFVARFIGFENFIGATYINEQQYAILPDVILNITQTSSHQVNDKVMLTIRPDHIQLTDEQQGHIEGVINVRTFLGKHYQYEISSEIGTLLVNDVHVYEVKTLVYLRLATDKIVVLQS